MNFFNKMAEKFLTANRRLKKWQRVVSVLAAVVVFVTTYALVLPAITLDKETASTQAGMEIAASEQEPGSDGTVYEAEPEEEPDEVQAESGEAEPQAESASEDSGSQEAEVSEDSEDQSGESEDADSGQDTTETAETVEEVQLITEKTQLSYRYIDENFETDPDDNVDDGYTVYAVFDADAKLPVGVELRVKEITKESDPEAYKAYYEKTLSEMQDKYDENTDLSFARFYDISFVYNGEEIEPSGYVKVRIEYNKPVEVKTDENVDTVHFDKNNDEKPEVIDSEIDSGKKGSEETVKTVQFESDQFSVYGVVASYTVDFHWEVDGKTYEFSIPGGGFVSFEALMEVLNVTADDEQDISVDSQQTMKSLTLNDIQIGEETKKFVEDVEDVEFSSPEYVWVGKVDDASTVGELKEAEELDVQYSTELTEKQIEEINAQTVEAGDWALISKQPFTTEETLSVTMKNGDQFEIKVTDAQIKKTVITASGKEYEITVTYDESAQIPGNAELRVRELTEQDEEYSALQNDITNNLSEELDSIPAHPILFDISIWANNEEVEPAEGSKVKVEIKLVKDSVKGKFTETDSPLLVNEAPIPPEKATITQKLQVIHQVEEGSLEIMETSEKISDKEVLSEFVTDSFSNWLLYLDEEFEDNKITIYQGDSLTLRPYGEWYWKKEDEPAALQALNWEFPTNEYNTQTGSQTVPIDYSGHTATYSGITKATTNDGKYTFLGYARYDRQLEEYYWFYDGTFTELGEFDLHIGNDRTIRVEVVQRPGDDDGKPGTVQGTSDIKVNLFDYDNGGVLDEGYAWSDGRWEKNHNLANNVFNNTVNIGHSLKFLSSGSGNSNTTNLNNYYQENPHQGLVNNTLSGGYPSLASSYGGESLKYLFDPSDTSWGDDAVIAYPDVRGLFLLNDDGYYYYNSNMNYAYYDGGNEITLYKHTYSQDTEGSNGVNGKPIGFFPYHPYDSTDHLHVNQEKALNHHFGMSMQVDFMMPTDKKNKGKDIIYEFSGDDDLWVYVDDQLVLDIGGIHQPVRGSINFTTGEVYVYGVNGGQPIINTTIQNLTPDEHHKLDMFYLERGGCDSNLSVMFNLPLVLGDVEFTKNGEVMNEDGSVGSHALSGAEFSLYDDEGCTGNAIYTATSGTDGKVAFTGIPLGTYFMKETKVPEGHKPNTTLYKVEILQDNTNPDAHNKVYAKVGNVWGELTTVLNEKDKTMITVEKDWVNKGTTTWPQDIQSIHVGLYYSVEGSDPAPLSSKTCDLDAQQTSYTFENLFVLDNNNKQITYSVKEESVKYTDGTVKTPEEAGIGVVIGGTAGNPKITNIINPDLPLYKIDSENPTKKLAGAEFIIEKKNADGNTWSNITEQTTFENIDGTPFSLTENKYFAIKEDGIIVKDLAAGEYRIVEKNPPDGYIIVANPVLVFKVEMGVIKRGNESLESFSIPNTPGTVLPQAGGPGTRLFTLIGAMLIAFAGFGITEMKRRVK